jgi:hypothetical protein
VVCSHLRRAVVTCDKVVALKKGEYMEHDEDVSVACLLLGKRDPTCWHHG